MHNTPNFPASSTARTHRGPQPKALTVLALVACLCTPGMADSIDFATQVEPILRRHCAKCHVGTRQQGGFSLNSRDTLLAGGESGPSVVPGDPAGSYFLDLLLEPDPDLRMPQEGDPLTAAEIQVLRDWIEQGVRWPHGFTFGELHRRAPIAPRSVSLPASAHADHPIDRLLEPYYAQHEVVASPPIGDRQFARRVSLDLTGLLPAPDQLAAFERDTQPNKQARLIDGLLNDRQAYADHWLSLWNDLLRNAYRGTGFIDGGRTQINAWLYGALYNNVPYDQFVRQLVNPVPGSEGFIRGIKWRGTVNDSQRREMQAAQNVSQVFLGTNLKCASCHDSFVNHWRVTDAYALAAVFSDQPLEIHRCDRPTGRMADPSFIFPELGAIDPEADVAERSRQLAELITSPANGRLARVAVNRLWAQLFGRGLIEPIEDMDAPAWHDDLLDWLAEDLVANGYDIQRTLRLMCTSRAYRLPAVDSDATATDEDYVFRGPLAKRMTAEQLLDALATITGHWPPPTPDMWQRDGRGQGGQLADIAPLAGLTPRSLPATTAQWIWSHADAMQSPAGETAYFIRDFSLAPRVTQAFGAFTADNELTVFVNGTEVARSDNWMAPVLVDITSWLRPGTNRIAVQATNRGSGPGAAGFIADVALYDHDQQLVERLPTNGSWGSAAEPPPGWPETPVKLAMLPNAVEIAPATGAPWAIADRIAPVPPSTVRVRSALFMDDPLNRALGRPIRDQVVMRRESLATSLQAMETTNGETFAQLLSEGARRCLQRGVDVDDLYETALGRPPREGEREVAIELLGEPATEEGYADLLWAVMMLPEFQMIH